MGRSDDLKAAHGELWRAATEHAFVVELGAGTLPLEKFRRYFVQDYVFVNDLARMSGIAIAKAPDLPSAQPVHEFLSNLMGAEDALFLRAFEELEVPEVEFRNARALPTTLAFGDFLVRTAWEGSWEQICAAMFVTEGVYMDWGERLHRAGARPEVAMYREWIEIHTEAVLGDFVGFLSEVVDSGGGDGVEAVFERALGFEVAFWDMAYDGESRE